MVLAEDLRQAVLQAALQGKLTEQLDTDSDVDEMLKNIQKEKEKLVADKKIKKEKLLPEIQDEDIPFEIPDNWRWGRLQSFLDVRDGTHDSPRYVENGIPFVTSKNLNNGKIDFSDVKYITKEDADFFNARSKVDKNDILMAMIGSIGKPVLVDIEQEFAIKNMALFKPVPKSNINMNYVLLLLEYAENIMKIQSTGGVQKFVSLTYLREFMSPFPPIEEQQRIVDKINEIMPKIDKYEKIEKELETLKKEFPTEMKDALLQAAMQGKLTEQLESDSSVDELLLNIEADRKAQISSGFIKKDKRLFTNYVDDEDMPIVIPANWRGVTIGSIVYKLTDGTHKTPKYAIDGVKFVSVKDISSGKLVLNDTKFITSEEHKELYKRCNPEKGDMLISKVGTTGVPAIIDTDEEFSLFVSVALLKYNHQFINEKFFYYLLKSPLVQEQVKENTRGIGNKNWVLDFIAKTIIVLPPIEEQQRIVERLDALLLLCEDLKEE